MLVTARAEQNGGYSFDKFDKLSTVWYDTVMWYITSGTLQGVSGKEKIHEAFFELYDSWVQQTGRHPDLGILGAASKYGFNYTPANTTFFMPECYLFEDKRIPKMSHDFDSPYDYFASLFDGLPDVEKALTLVTTPQDDILNDGLIDAPNSREDYWDDTIEVPEEFFLNEPSEK